LNLLTGWGCLPWGGITPPMTVTQGDMDWFLSGLDDVLTDIQRFPGAAWDTVTGLAKRAMTA
jgi:hypothetical protein